MLSVVAFLQSIFYSLYRPTSCDIYHLHDTCPKRTCIVHFIAVKFNFYKVMIKGKAKIKLNARMRYEPGKCEQKMEKAKF